MKWNKCLAWLDTSDILQYIWINHNYKYANKFLY